MLGFYNYTVVTTYIGLASAVLGMCFAIKGNTLLALLCLLLSGVLDGIDGKIARTRSRTAHEKRFGIQIDSLCDLICFGVLPCAIGYSIGMDRVWSVAIMVCYTLAAIIRLAYFNVMEEERQQATDDKRKYYEGLPVTTIALILPFVFCFKPFVGSFFVPLCELTFLLVALAFLSRFRVRKPNNLVMALMILFGAAELVVLLLAKYYHVL